MAVEYAYLYHYDNPIYEYVFWVRADTEAILDTEFSNIASQLALPIADGTPEDKISAVKSWLSVNSNWLLVFDNADTPDWLFSFCSCKF